VIDIQPLSILREIDRTGSLTQAADRLNLTQSAVSHAIRRFEERHGVKLWEREGHKLRLTLAGEYLLGLAMRVLPQLERGAAVLEDYARGRRGAIRVGMECHPCQDWLMRVVDPFLAAWPDVDLDVTTAFQFGGLAALLAMLNSCASGVSVVNIDNGFGAGHLAALINQRIVAAQVLPDDGLVTA